MTSLDSNFRTIPQNSYLRIGNEAPEKQARDPDLGIADGYQNNNPVTPGLEFDLTNAPS